MMTRAERLLSMLEYDPETDDTYRKHALDTQKKELKHYGWKKKNIEAKAPEYEREEHHFRRLARTRGTKTSMGGTSDTYSRNAPEVHKTARKIGKKANQGDSWKKLADTEQKEKTLARYKKFKDTVGKERDTSKVEKATQRAKEAKQHHQDMIRHSMSGKSRQGVLDKIGSHVQNMPGKEKIKAGAGAVAVGAGALALKKIRDKRRKARREK
jgi:hypothetical protein